MGQQHVHALSQARCLDTPDRRTGNQTSSGSPEPVSVQQGFHPSHDQVSVAPEHHGRVRGEEATDFDCVESWRENRQHLRDLTNLQTIQGVGPRPSVPLSQDHRRVEEGVCGDSEDLRCRASLERILADSAAAKDADDEMSTSPSPSAGGSETAVSIGREQRKAKKASSNLPGGGAGGSPGGRSDTTGGILPGLGRGDSGFTDPVDYPDEGNPILNYWTYDRPPGPTYVERTWQCDKYFPAKVRSLQMIKYAKPVETLIG